MRVGPDTFSISTTKSWLQGEGGSTPVWSDKPPGYSAVKMAKGNVEEILCDLDKKRLLPIER